MLVGQVPANILVIFAKQYDIDFLAVRKIPLRERHYLVDDMESSQASSDLSPSGSREAQDERLRGHDVERMLAKIRAVVLQDRDIHDKVRRQC